MDVTNKFPYNKIQPIVVDGQYMVRIPKFYIKCCQGPAGSQHANQQMWLISEPPGDGYHCHPAFMLNGKECQAKDLSCYIATRESDGKPGSQVSTSYNDGRFWGNISYNDIHSTAQMRNTGTGEQSGWAEWDIYDHHMLALLMLIEYGTSDMQTQLGTDNVVYRGIHDPWGAPHSSEWFWIGGLTTDGSCNIQIYDNKGNHSMVNTGVTFGNSINSWLWPITTHTEKGDNYDLGDVFLCKDGASPENGGSFSDQQACYAGCAFLAYDGTGTDCGPFYLPYNSPSYSYCSSGFRLARYVE